jgi:hypothetical protein
VILSYCFGGSLLACLAEGPGRRQPAMRKPCLAPKIKRPRRAGEPAPDKAAFAEYFAFGGGRYAASKAGAA